ncbi:MAG: hypothetical protein WDN67_05255 [Candidatus Moraniibacteriota bacterium]
MNAREDTILEGAVATVIRAYRAFLYPEGAAMTFRPGSLLTDGTRFYLVSEGTLRDFATPETAGRLGYRQNSSCGFAPEDLVNEKDGPMIGEEASPLIEDALFSIGGNYYQAKSNTLVPFVSDRAFFSQFRVEDALPRDPGFLETHPVTNDTTLGFLPGTLLSYGEAVYMVSTANTLRPIDSPDTFLAKGYQWDSIIAANGEEFGIYTLGGLYSIKQPHPDGTVFYAEDRARSFVVENGTKRVLPNDPIAMQFRSVVPVTVHSLPPEQSCMLKKSFWIGSYGCSIPLDAFAQELAGEYQFSLTAKNDLDLDNLNADFIRYLNRANLSAFVNDLITKLASRY